MPRIPDDYLDCVVYLYPSEAAAAEGLRAGGSGFLVGVPTEGLRQNFWMLYAISNRHVVANAAALRLNTRDGKTTIMATSRSNWVFHPSGDDLAACVISFDPMVIKFNHVPRHNFLSKELVTKFNIGPGDDTFMIGRFINHEGRQTNLPTVRFGTIGQMPWETIRQDDGFEQESFLVEARSIGGYSGSPIFVSIPPLSERSGIENWYPPTTFVRGQPPIHFDPGFLRAHGPWLLGVDWGHINNWSPVCRDSGEPVNPANPNAMQVKLNTGMTAAIPAWKLAELLDAGPLAEHRKGIERQIMEYEAKNPPIASIDATA